MITYSLRPSNSMPRNSFQDSILKRCVQRCECKTCMQRQPSQNYIIIGSKCTTIKDWLNKLSIRWNTINHIKNVTQSRRHNPHILQTILQNYSNQRCGIGIKNSHMYQWNTKESSKNKSTHLESINLWQGSKNIKCER